MSRSFLDFTVMRLITTLVSGARAFIHPRDQGRLARGLLLMLLMGGTSLAFAAEAIRPFIQGSLAQVLAQREGKPFILVLWSLECQYCPTELKMLSELKRAHPKLDVVLVATDEVSDAPQLLSRTESYGIA